ncbi:ankyrin repeat-containing domain protein [Aspergillus carlsbadensis]|nr:ankyrin repeat-containing domain protein [Aspergillus carlsbadensis]
MVDFNLFELPEELVAQVTHHLSASELASFVRTSKTSQRIGYDLLYSMSLEKLQGVIDWAIFKNQAQKMVHLFRYNWRTVANHPNLTHGPLDYACKKGKAALVRTLHDAGLLSNVSLYKQTFSPLETAAIYGHTEVVRILIEARATAGTHSFSDNFSIVCRGQPDRLEIARLLVSHGINANELDEGGNNFLHHACKRTPSSAGTICNVKLLLDLGLDTNNLNGNGETALTLASRCRSLDVVRLLVARGADVNVVGPEGDTPLQALLSESEDPYEIAKIILNGGAVITVDSGLRLIRHAFLNDWPRTIAHLVAAWRDQMSNQLCPDPNLVFCAAAAAGNVIFLEQLLQRGGVDPNCEVHGKTALVAAAEAGQNETLSFLIPHVSNYDKRSKNGRTALHIAVICGEEMAARLLLQHTRFLNITDDFGRTPLLDAVEHQSSSFVRVLLDEVMGPRGTVFDILETEPDTIESGKWLLGPSQMLQSAVELAVELGKVDILCILLECKNALRVERRSSRLLFTAIDSRHEGAAIELIKWGLPLEDTDREDYTPLMRAAEAGQTRVVRALIEQGANLETKSSTQETAMSLAVTRNRPEVVRCLVAANANSHSPARLGTSNQRDIIHNLFTHAVLSNHGDVVRALAPLYDVNEANLDGNRTLLHVAARKGYVKVVRNLLSIDNVDVSVKDEYGQTAWDYAMQSSVKFPKELLDRLGGAAPKIVQRLGRPFQNRRY